MFDRLPLEILLHCAAYLSKNDQLECIRINKRTYNSIQASGKFHESVSISKLEAFELMHAFYDKHKELGKLVKKMLISEVPLDIHSYTALPAIFPNMKDFKFINPYHPVRDGDNKQFYKAFKPWATTLTSLEESGVPISAFSLLANVPCPKLEYLSLNIIGMDDEIQKFVVYDYLKNCPNVKILALKYLNTTFEHMEKIHEYLPHLKAIALSQVGLPPEPLSGKPTPALQMETFYMEEATFMGNMGTWLLYIGQKYPNLKNLIIGRAEDMDDGDMILENKYQDSLIRLATGLKNLEFYSIKCLKLTPRILKAMDTSGIQLKKIELGLWGAEDSFKLLMKSQQINYLTSLTVSGISYQGMAYGNRKKKFVQDLGKIPNLRHLRINQSRDEVYPHDHNRVPLDFILESCKSLESIQMDFLTLEIARKTEIPFDTKLKKLLPTEIYVKAAVFKDDEDWEEKSFDLLEKLLPNTEIVVRNYDDIPEDEEYQPLLTL